MPIALKRVYEAPEPGDGYRVLVDRLWPRGKSKEKARIDQWIRDAAPSNELRKSFHSGDINWKTFRESYLHELEEYRDLLLPLAEMALVKQMTLVYSSKEKEFNNAAVLRDYLEEIAS